MDWISYLFLEQLDLLNELAAFFSMALISYLFVERDDLLNELTIAFFTKAGISYPGAMFLLCLLR